MTTAVLLQAQPRQPSNGAVVQVRLAGGGARPYMQHGFSDWRSGIANLPRFRSELGFEQAGWTGGALPQTGALQFRPADKALASSLANLYWADAAIVVTAGDDEAASPAYPTQLVGTVAAARAEGGTLTLTITDSSQILAKPFASTTFAGTGGAEGGDEATGRVKRRSLGYVFNVEGRVLVKADNVYEFGDPSRALNAFPMVKDKGREASAYVDVAWQGSVTATLDALRASSPPDGGCARAPSIACVKWWTTPAGPLTADIKGEVGAGYVETVPSIAARIIADVAPSITITNLSEAQGWQAAQAGLHVDSGSELANAVLDRLLLPVSIAWVLNPDGTLVFRRLAWTASVGTLAADTIAREETFKPLRTRRVGFQQNNRVHSDAEISAALLTGIDVTYVDGTPIETLKPAQGGADRTSANTAAAITNQGAFATINTAAYGSQYLTGFGALAPLGNVYFGSPYLLEASGGAQALLNAFKTIQGIAASITGQGAFATVNSAAYGSSLLTGFGALAPLASLALGGAFLFRADGTTRLSDATVVTAQGTAASITGQGAFATVNTAAYGSSLLTGFGGLAALASINFGSAQLLESSGGAQATLAAFKTSQGTAAAIAGQGPWATEGTPVQALYRPGVNLIYDGGLKLRASSWSLGSWSYGFSTQPFLSTTVGNAQTGMYFPAAGNVDYALQLETGSGGSSASGAYIYIAWYDGAGAYISDSGRTPSTPHNAGVQRQTAVVRSPSNASRGLMVLFGGSISSGTVFVQRMKVEQGSYPTAFSDEATTGALYANNSSIDSLMPAEKGSNVTETRTAAAIVQQSPFATANQLSRDTVGNNRSFFAINAFSLNYTIRREDGTSVVTESLAITSLGIASAVSGQGALATKNQTNTGDIVTGAVGRGTAAGGSGSTRSGLTTIVDITFTPVSSESLLFVDVSAVVARSATSPTATRAEIVVAVNNVVLIDRFIPGSGAFAWPLFIVNRSGAQRFTLSVAFTNDAGSGDPHTIDEANIRILEIKK